MHSTPNRIPPTSVGGTRGPAVRRHCRGAAAGRLPAAAVFGIVALLASLGVRARGPGDATLVINSELKPVIVKVPKFPFVDKAKVAKVKVTLRLKEADSKPNQITDDEDWFARNVLPHPPLDLSEESRFVPADTRWGILRHFRSNGNDLFVGVYQETQPRKDGVYDTHFLYRAVVFDKDYNPLRIFVLDNFFPDILEMSTMQPVGNILYFDCNYNGYASILEKKTGYLVAMDLTTGDVLWASKNLTASAWHFLVLDDTLVAGYGFTDEPDFLYLLNRHDGSLLQTVKLKSAHSFLIAKGNRLYVRTYDTDYVFDIKR